MKITHEEQAWALEGLRIILRRLEFQAQESIAVGYADSRDILKCQNRVKSCRRLIDSFENLTFEE